MKETDMNHEARSISIPNSNSNSKTVRFGLSSFTVILSSALILTWAARVQAATLCVDQHHKAGCVDTISAAVAAAAPGDTINVDPGVYREDVVIGKSLSLVGASPETTFIDAAAFSNGVFVDGLDNSNLSQVIVTGFTIENANFEGVLVIDADDVMISGDVISGNDKSLQHSSSACPGLPAFETAEGSDCGEGVHLIGATHNVVENNSILENAGGILISDETNTSHDNLVTRNLVVDNPYNSGITLASHPAYTGSGPARTPYGIYNNVILENALIHSGGGGISLLAAASGNRVYANTIAGNRLTSNAMPGIVVHTMVDITATGAPPNPDASRNVITGNFISGNGADPALPTSATAGISIFGADPIISLVVSGNTIDDEAIDVAFDSASTLNIHGNNLIGGVGIANLNTVGMVNARENWWGCSGGPGTRGCSTVTGGASVIFTPWLTGPVGVVRGFLLDLGLDHDHSCNHRFGRF
jgi:parallel beta-helix repeat protein